jgi:hypothetical protein
MRLKYTKKPWFLCVDTHFPAYIDDALFERAPEPNSMGRELEALIAESHDVAEQMAEQARRADSDFSVFFFSDDPTAMWWSR